MSCESKTSPNEFRGESHWILYDFGDIYELGETHIWNLSNPNYMTSGISELIIDYSIDGEFWQEWGSYSIPISNGSGFYEGTQGPDLTDIQARYVLLTAISNHGGDCYGLSEIRINTSGVVVPSSNKDVSYVSADIFPNPADQVVHIVIDFNGANNLPIRIFDSNGSLVHEGLINSSNPYSVNTKNLPSGNYVLSLGERIVLSQKIITVSH